MEKIAIDSLTGLIDYIVEYDLDDTNKSQLRELENTVGLHLSLGMYIRNNYELSDLNQVPNLLSKFKISCLRVGLNNRMRAMKMHWICMNFGMRTGH